MPSRDYYEVLGIGRAASADDIRRAHRKLALEFHPDRNKSKDAAARFAEIQQAYEVLSDTDKRSQYDEFIRLGGSPGAFGSGSGAGAGHARPQHGGGASGQYGGPGGWNPGDWTSSDSQTFEEIFGEAFGPRGGRARSRGGARTRARERHEAEASVPLEVAIKGGKVGVVLDPDQHGRQTSVELPIPAGLEDEELLSVPGRLDLVVRARIAPHAWLSREGRDLSYDLPLSIVEATLGASIDAPLPTGGTVALKIPAGTASGKKIRIAGKGMPAGSGRPAGDLFVVIQIVPPKGVNDLTRSLLDEVAGSIENPRARIAHLRP